VDDEASVDLKPPPESQSDTHVGRLSAPTVARCSTLVYLRRSCDRALARQCDEYSHSDPKPAAGNRASALSGGERGDLVGATERGRIPGSSRRPGMSVTRHSFCCRPTFHSIGQLAERRGSVALRFGNPHEQWVGLPIQACPKGRTRLRSTNGSVAGAVTMSEACDAKAGVDGSISPALGPSVSYAVSIAMTERSSSRVVDRHGLDLTLPARSGHYGEAVGSGQGSGVDAMARTRIR